MNHMHMWGRNAFISFKDKPLTKLSFQTFLVNEKPFF